MEPGSAVIAFSSAAAVNGSPLSGGYAGAKATIRFIASYAAAESGRNAFLDRLGPALTPEQAGTAIADIAAGADDRDAYLLTATGLTGTPEPSRATPGALARPQPGP